MLHCYLRQIFKKLYPSTSWALPSAKHFSALPESKTEQLWQCNSIKSACLISLVSCLKCFWSHYPNHLPSHESSSGQEQLPLREEPAPLGWSPRGNKTLLLPNRRDLCLVRHYQHLWITWHFTAQNLCSCLFLCHYLLDFACPSPFWNLHHLNNVGKKYNFSVIWPQNA